MSLRNIGIVYRKELSEALRDRRTLFSALIAPLLLFPLLSAGFGALAMMMVDKAKNEVPKIMVFGGEDSPQVLDGLHKLKKIEIVPTAANWKDQIANKEIRVAVDIPPQFEKSVADGKAATVKIYNYEGEMKSSFATGDVEKYFRDYSDTVVKQRLAAKDLASSIL